MKYCIEELVSFYIGKGSERICFRSPEDPESVIKISPVSNAKQTVREIDYFQYLEKKKVPFTHIPKFKGMVELDGYTGFEQESVLDKRGNRAFSLGDYMKSKADFCLRSFRSEKKDTLFHDLFDCLCRFNIIVCDLSLSNILVDERRDQPKLV